MKLAYTQEQLMINHIKDQLHELGYLDTEGKTKRELKLALARERAIRVEAGNPESGWF
ncbi:hypothetical protein [Oceanobacillus profundus]|uniref:hypothetical protein n=1 Tax=Oceanobacillus profundus TaxID=372463 RepID=UPI0013144F13|nr:hypothetical protein [Oceanobacillus profundus]